MHQPLHVVGSQQSGRVDEDRGAGRRVQCAAGPVALLLFGEETLDGLRVQSGLARQLLSRDRPRCQTEHDSNLGVERFDRCAHRFRLPRSGRPDDLHHERARARDQAGGGGLLGIQPACEPLSDRYRATGGGGRLVEHPHDALLLLEQLPRRVALHPGVAQRIARDPTRVRGREIHAPPRDHPRRLGLDSPDLLSRRPSLTDRQARSHLTLHVSERPHRPLGRQHGDHLLGQPTEIATPRCRLRQRRRPPATLAPARRAHRFQHHRRPVPMRRRGPKPLAPQTPGGSTALLARPRVLRRVAREDRPLPPRGLPRHAPRRTPQPCARARARPAAHASRTPQAGPDPRRRSPPAPAHHRPPPHPQTSGQLGPQRRLIQRPQRPLIAIHHRRVQRPPSPGSTLLTDPPSPVEN